MVTGDAQQVGKGKPAHPTGLMPLQMLLHKCRIPQGLGCQKCTLMRLQQHAQCRAMYAAYASQNLMHDADFKWIHSIQARSSSFPSTIVDSNLCARL